MKDASFTRRPEPIWLSLAEFAALAPAIWLGLAIAFGWLGVDPVGQAIRLSGRYAIAMLLIALLPGPLARIGGLRWAMRLRKPLGLYAFAYAAGHMLLYAGWDFRFQVTYLLQTLRSSRFIAVGLASLVILLALAITSPKGWQRRLGKGWRRLHRFVLLAAALATLHYAWATKELRTLPILAAIAVLALAVVRIPSIERTLRRIRRGGTMDTDVIEPTAGGF